MCRAGLGGSVPLCTDQFVTWLAVVSYPASPERYLRRLNAFARGWGGPIAYIEGLITSHSCVEVVQHLPFLLCYY